VKAFALVTPENVEFEYRLAGLARRGIAWGIDQAFVAIAVAALAYPLGLLLPVVRGFGLAAELVAYFAVSTLYPIVLEWRRGQTLGKRAMRIRVLSERGTPVTLSEAAVRNLVRVLDAIPLAYLVGGLAAWISRDAKRLGDLAAGTIVVEEASLSAPASLRDADAGRHNTFREEPGLLTLARRRLSPADLEMLLDLCLRRATLDETARLDLFARAAGRVRALLARPALDAVADERLVVNCVDALLAERGAKPRRGV